MIEDDIEEEGKKRQLSDHFNRKKNLLSCAFDSFLSLVLS